MSNAIDTNYSNYIKSKITACDYIFLLVSLTKEQLYVFMEIYYSLSSDWDSPLKIYSPSTVWVYISVGRQLHQILFFSDYKS